VKPIHTRNRTIGLLGGSFNPAHGGHLHITLYALKKLGFDQVWWLVSPHNPLKNASSLETYEKRLASARAVAAGHPRIRVLDIEQEKTLHFSWQTIRYLQRRFPAAQFAWLMGADNLAQFHRWKKWQKIARQLPVIVFDRAPYSHTALRSRTYSYMHKFLLKSMDINPWKTAPSLAFVHLRRDPLSSTQLRKTLGKGAFLRHN
jgi:nicotinate-nucleotide adenylyltransferase